MVYFVALIESSKWLAVKKEWVQNPFLGQTSKIFFSPNENAVPDFTKPSEFYLNKDSDEVYNGFVYRQFGEYDRVRLWFCLIW